MANKTVSFWKQSTGITGQCLTERTQALFDRVSAMYNDVTGKKLSKMRLYEQARVKAREAKQEIVGKPRMMDTASAAFGIQLKELEKSLREIRKAQASIVEVQFDTMEVSNLRDLAQQTVGRKRKQVA